MSRFRRIMLATFVHGVSTAAVVGAFTLEAWASLAVWLFVVALWSWEPEVKHE